MGYGGSSCSEQGAESIIQSLPVLSRAVDVTLYGVPREMTVEKRFPELLFTILAFLPHKRFSTELSPRRSIGLGLHHRAACSTKILHHLLSASTPCKEKQSHRMGSAGSSPRPACPLSLLSLLPFALQLMASRGRKRGTSCRQGPVSPVSVHLEVSLQVAQHPSGASQAQCLKFRFFRCRPVLETLHEGKMGSSGAVSGLEGLVSPQRGTS